MLTRAQVHVINTTGCTSVTPIKLSRVHTLASPTGACENRFLFWFGNRCLEYFEIGQTMLIHEQLGIGGDES